MSVLPSAGTILTVAPALLSFTAFDGGPDPQTQLLTVNNPGSQPLHWSLANDTSPTTGELVSTNWLSTDQTSGTVAPQTTSFIRVTARSQNLLPGTYTNTLVLNVDQETASNSQAVSISLTVQPRCELRLNSGSLSFSTVSGKGNPDLQAVTINASASCTNTINWQANSSAQWITVSSTQGQLGNAAMSTTTLVGVNVTGLQPGTYTAPIFFSTGQSTQSVLVQLTISDTSHSCLTDYECISTEPQLQYNPGTGQSAASGHRAHKHWWECTLLARHIRYANLFLVCNQPIRRANCSRTDGPDQYTYQRG